MKRSDDFQSLVYQKVAKQLFLIILIQTFLTYLMHEYQENLFSFAIDSYISASQSHSLDIDSKYSFQFDFFLDDQGSTKNTKSDQNYKTLEKTDLNATNIEVTIHGEVEINENINIQYSQASRLKIIKIIQGSKNDTVQLNINFKTILTNYFKQLYFLNELTPHEKSLFQLFANRTPSFKSLILFTQNTNEISSIRPKIIAFIESKQIIMKILSSGCSMVTKIQMIKFIEILRINVLGIQGIKKWKQLSSRFV